jgi:hypothetical protein
MYVYVRTNYKFFAEEHGNEDNTVSHSSCFLQNDNSNCSFVSSVKEQKLKCSYALALLLAK